MIVWRGPRHSGFTVILAPGDNGQAQDPVPTALAVGLAQVGVLTARFSAPQVGPIAQDRALADGIRAAALQRSGHLVLGGLSRGARVSVGLASELGAVGLLLLAFPFHPRGDPDPAGLDRTLAAATVPVLLIQGTRDTHGNREQVRGYRLPPHIRQHWVEHANHGLVPRLSSGITSAELLPGLVQVARNFVLALA